MNLRKCLHDSPTTISQLFFRLPKGKTRLIVYMTAGEIKINGGVMSIFSQADNSRKLVKEAAVIVTTYPHSRKVYAFNRRFPNKEHVWRWEKTIKAMKRFDDVLIHIPEYYVEDFYNDLGEEGREALKQIKRLSINIMDQNILYMPAPEIVNRLREFTPRLTQTCAHKTYATQEFADKFNLPTIHLPAILAMDSYKRYPFEKKEKRIVYSPDPHPMKEEILALLKENFPDFEFYRVKKLPFPKYLNLVSRSYFSITFGEGMDGYFSMPYRMKSIAFAVYNPEFFANDRDWSKVWCIFSSYEDMKAKICDYMRECLSSKAVYEAHVEEARKQFPAFSMPDKERFLRLTVPLQRFYNGDFDCYPKAAN